jgi:hypothetical protein
VAEHFVSSAATTVRDVGRMMSAAKAARKRLLTFTIEAELCFADPAEVHSFTAAVAEAIARTGEQCILSAEVAR